MNRPHNPPKIPNKEKETSKKEKKPDIQDETITKVRQAIIWVCGICRKGPDDIPDCDMCNGYAR